MSNNTIRLEDYIGNPVCDRLISDLMVFLRSKSRPSKTVAWNLEDEEIEELAKELTGLGLSKMDIPELLEKGKVSLNGVRLGRLKRS